MRKRNIEIGSLALAVPDLSRIAGEERIVVVGIGMDRDRENVTAVIEDLLGTIAVVRVDVDDGDFCVSLTQVPRRRRRVVQVAEATGAVRAGMVARGPAEGVDRRL